MARKQQVKIFLGLLAFGIVAAALLAGAYYFVRVLAPQRSVNLLMEERVQDPDVSQPDPGRKVFQEAVDLIEQGEISQAAERLDYLRRYYPDSAKFSEAERILGEINVDRLLSTDPGKDKIRYTVKRGDSISRIASRNQCTQDFIIRANGRVSTWLQPGDILWIARLDFSLEVDVSELSLLVKRLGAEGESRFFKRYAVVHLNLPSTVRVPYESSISEKPAWAGSRPTGFSVSLVKYFEAHRWLQTRKPGLVIQAVPDDLENASYEHRTGILLAPEDLRELYTIIRPGAKLKLVE